MQKYCVGDSLDTAGAFWYPSAPDNIITGTIRTEAGRVHLLTSPTHKDLDSESLSRAFVGFAKPSESTHVDVIHGKTREGICTLFHLHEELGRGVTNFPAGYEIVADSYRVSSTLMGIHVESAEAECLSSASFYFTKIHTWMPKPWTLHYDERGLTCILPCEPVKIFQFTSTALGAEVMCEITQESSVSNKKGLRYKSVPRVVVQPGEKRSYSWFLSIAHRLENFFSLFLGSSISLRRLQLLQEGMEGWVIQKMLKRNESVDLESWVRCSGETLAEALDRWLAVPEEDRALEKTLLSMVRKSSLFVEAEFLSLAQSLEAFGRLHFKEVVVPESNWADGLSKIEVCITELWGKSPIAKRCMQSLAHANELSFRQRIRKTCALLSEELCKRVIPSKETFTNNILETRNYLTHPGIPKTSGVVTGLRETYLLNQKLHALLRCVMLVKLGLSEEVLTEPICYQSSKWR